MDCLKLIKASAILTQVDIISIKLNKKDLEDKHSGKTRLPAVVTVGDELVLGERGNENSRWMSEWLKQNFHPAGIQLSLPDDGDTIAQWLKELLKGGHFPILVAGGIGGTHDDCTRAGIAQALGVPLTRHPECWEILVARYDGREMNESRSNMAMLPEGCTLIENPHGAPGFEMGGIFAFPGFPNMLQAMLPVLQDRFGPQGQESQMHEQQVRLKTREGDISDAVREFSRLHPECRLGIYAHSGSSWGEVSLRFRYPDSRDDLSLEFRQFVKGLGRPVISEP